VTTISSLCRAKEFLLRDAIRRDLTTARRAALLDILWDERFLTRDQLIARVEQVLRPGCFGAKAWQDNFYRDMRVVKGAFQKAGRQIAFSRGKASGYYVVGQPALSPEVTELIQSSIAEIDPQQMEIIGRLSPAQRFRQGCAISDAARRVVAYRIRQDNPGIGALEANRMALQRAYQDE
jgi:hypothetical protein